MATKWHCVDPFYCTIAHCGVCGDTVFLRSGTTMENSVMNSGTTADSILSRVAMSRRTNATTSLTHPVNSLGEVILSELAKAHPGKFRPDISRRSVSRKFQSCATADVCRSVPKGGGFQKLRPVIARVTRMPSFSAHS